VALFSSDPEYDPTPAAPPRTSTSTTPRRVVGDPSPFNWFELYEGFEIPRNIDASQFPPYGNFDPDIPEPIELLRLGDLLNTPSYAWAAWYSARKSLRLPNIPLEHLEAIAWKKYGTARYIALVPQWRRALVELATEIDDVEDQVSTILWILEGVSKKVIPLPPRALSFADDLRKMLDYAQDALTPLALGRGAKTAWTEHQAEARRKVRSARGKNAKIIVWLQDNFGRILEAAQATGTWFDVGIIIGPIFGYIEEGMWGLAEKLVDNYLVAADALLPGYREDFYRNAEEIGNQVEDVMGEWWEDVLDLQIQQEEAFPY